MSRVLVSLVGEQPVPNLLPVRHIEPAQVLLVHTGHTERTAQRLAGVIGHASCEFLQTGPYGMTDIRDRLVEWAGHRALGNEVLFNLTGGTKLMAFAALEVARQRAAAVLYYESEGGLSLLHSFRWSEGYLQEGRPEQVTTLVTADEFLRLYVGKYETKEYKDDLEQVGDALGSLGPEYDLLTNVHLVGVAGNVEVDFVLTRRNQLAVGQVKRTASKTKGIDQLLAATDQRTLGTYTRRILVTTQELDTNSVDLAEAHRIRVVVLSSARAGALSDEDRDRLLAAVREEMEPAREAWG